MISSLAWVRKGAPARHPRKFNITDDEELERVRKLTNLEFGDAQQQLQEAQREAGEMDDANGGGAAGNEWEDDEDDADDDVESTAQEAADQKADADMDAEDPDGLAKYNLDTYDDEQSTGIAMGAFSNIKGLSFHKSNDDDPYITLKDGADDEEEQEDREALEVVPEDNMLISAKTEDDVSMLEAHVYASVNDEAPEGSSLYVHHDLLLPSFPLSLEWVGHSPAASTSKTPASAGSNYLAVSTMDPEVEIWDMDVIDGLVPDCVLGNRDASRTWEKEAKKKGTGKKKRKVLAVRPTSALWHTDAVLSVAWNPLVPNLLATSSADHTVKLWDLNAKPNPDHGGIEAVRSFDGVHSDKVQSVAWNTSGSSLASATGADAASRASILASGGYDGYIKVWDVRQPDVVLFSIKVDGEIERIKWNPWKVDNLIVALDTGIVHSFDVSRASADASRVANGMAASPKPTWTLSAHESACTSLDVSPHIPGCLVTAGLDRLTKLWNIVGDGAGEVGATPMPATKREITLVTSRDLGAGKVFAAHFSPDDPLTVAAAGSTGSVKVWDALGARGVRDVFSGRLKEHDARVRAGVARGKQTQSLAAKVAAANGDGGEDGDRVVEVEEDEEEDEDEEEEEGDASVDEAAGEDADAAMVE